MSNIGLSIQMSHFAKALIILVMVSSVGSIAQTPTTHFLPLQPHKVQWANAVIKNALKTKDTIQLAEGWYLYGKIYEAAGDYLTAKRYFLRSLKIQEKRGDSFELSRLYYRLTTIEGTLFHYKEAYHYAHLALQVAERINSYKALSLAYGSVQSIHDMDWSEGGKNKKYPSPNYDSALYYLRKKEKLINSYGTPLDMSAVMVNLGAELQRRNDPKAIDYYQKSLDIFLKKQNPAEIVIAKLQLGQACLQFKQLRKVKSLIQEIEQEIPALPSYSIDKTFQTSINALYRDYYAATGNWQKAFDYAQRVHGAEYQKLHADREGAISRLSVEYETEQKEAELKAKQLELQLSQQNQQTQQRFVQILVVLLVGALGISIAFYRISVKNHRLSESNALLVREQNHRVKNNLQLVSSLLNLQLNRLTDDATKNVLEETQLRIEVMSVLQRTLYTGQTLGEVNVHDFLTEIVKVGLQTFDYEHVQVQTNISPSLHLPIDHAMRIGLIINELLTNACKYAFPDHEAPQWSLSCEQSNRLWTLQVADNGPGFIPEKPINKKSSFGMRLIQLQADQLYAKYAFEIQNGSLFRLNFKV
ncbi:two-component sensor histidine kinase [Runella defluvii]|uniref:histidine kinase n=1 Tax=Runella defluvii TaxID=370973 RepID=A0A7W5ZGS9_9BACT|nr:sensor histidine kinase [Runella defluvii]MBB3836290.1 two-component sensor histidine kinase [Runella defluvii]